MTMLGFGLLVRFLVSASQHIQYKILSDTIPNNMNIKTKPPPVPRFRCPFTFTSGPYTSLTHSVATVTTEAEGQSGPKANYVRPDHIGC